MRTYNQEEQWLLTEKFNNLESEAFQADLVLLHTGTPLAYLIGSIPFLDCVIHLDSHPLIPRTETEFWTEKAITSIRQSAQNDKNVKPDSEELVVGPLRILDLCAGSGAIGVAVAKALPTAQVTFGEIDASHCATIEKNLIANNIPDARCRVSQSDLFENIPTTYDYILTNPPYIDPAVDRAEPSVKLHEPSLALYGGVKGMECIEKIITQASAHLTHHGQLWIEHEPEQSVQVEHLAKNSSFSCTTHKDQYDVERYSILVLQ